jgi:chemotaxis protein CheC
LKEAELAFWAELVSKGTTNSMSSLSQMVGRDIRVASFALRQVPVAQISNLMGGPESMSVGIYLTVSGSAEGHIMLMYEPKMACGFVDMLMELPHGSTETLGEMEQSALGEMGNVVGSAFLNILADSTGLDLRPSPPTVMMDMAGALLDIICADILLTQDDAFVAETTFQAPDREISGMFFIIPNENLLRVLLETRQPASC